MQRSYALAHTRHECRRVSQTDRHVGAQRGCDGAPVEHLSVCRIDAADRAQNRCGVRRATTQSRRHGKMLFEHNAPKLNPRLGLRQTRKCGRDDVVAANRRSEGARDAQGGLAARHKSDDVAEAGGKDNEAFDLVVTVLTAARDLQGEVDLRPCRLGDHGH